MIHTLILMAGPDSQFSEAGYTFPKNLIEINGSPLIQRFTDKTPFLKKETCGPIFLLRRSENRKNYTGKVIHLLLEKAKIVEVEENVGGAACSALMAIEHIAEKDPLVIMNGDQIVDFDIEKAFSYFQENNFDAGTVVFKAVHPRWSYVLCDEQDLVIEAAEKRPISDLACVGVYYFRCGGDFLSAAMDMIKKDAQINGNFYITPCLNELILKQKKIGTYLIPRNSYIPLKTPQNIRDYDESLKNSHAN